MSLEVVPSWNNLLKSRRKDVVFALKNAAPTTVGFFPEGEVVWIVAYLVVRKLEGKVSYCYRLDFRRDDGGKFRLVVETR